MEKITKREMFEALATYAETTDMEVQIGDAVVTAADFAAFATKEIEQLDKKAVKAKERAAVKRADGDALTEAVLAVLTNEFQTAADIAAQIEDEDTTVAKISYRLGSLVKNGRVIKEDIKVDREGKRTVLKGYRLS